MGKTRATVRKLKKGDKGPSSGGPLSESATEVPPSGGTSPARPTSRDSLSSLDFLPPAPAPPTPALARAPAPAAHDAPDAPDADAAAAAAAKKRKTPKKTPAPEPAAKKRKLQLPAKQADNSVNVKAATSKKASSKELLAQREKEMLELKAQLALRDEKLTHAEDALKALKEKEAAKPLPLIPKPPGQAGRLTRGGYSLIKAMGLEHDKPLYNELQAAVRAAFQGSQLLTKDRLSDYAPADLVGIFKIVSSNYAKYNLLTLIHAAHAHPELKAYEGDWASTAILKHYLKNTKADKKAKLKMRNAKKDAGVDQGKRGGKEKANGVGEVPDEDEDDGEEEDEPAEEDEVEE
ncbi:hypothetical protein CALVIDRAFT_530933 [Calocera viscosa TUFC12733]|uniref:Uncharacterized protein n=1 Tax=Calocera viscosa (strain TUFC12733) TaxID=1330018 RepID=A0A167H845_CALVF|nr:hypothetical protein CALVIDRAFT_530933 [Calocera viscosa TUFC12733]